MSALNTASPLVENTGIVVHRTPETVFRFMGERFFSLKALVEAEAVPRQPWHGAAKAPATVVHLRAARSRVPRISWEGQA